MKKLLTPTLLITGLLALAGCGGSGTPLPQPPKTAKITFYAVSTARNYDLIISDYVIAAANPVVLPNELSVPIEPGTTALIASNYLKAFSSNYAFGSFQNSNGTAEITVSSWNDPTSTTTKSPSNLGFGKFAELTCVLANQALTKQAVFASYTSKNHSSSRIVTAKHFDPTDPLSNKTTPVFYNISVSVQ